jgi:hypothetical protein
MTVNTTEFVAAMTQRGASPVAPVWDTEGETASEANDEDVRPLPSLPPGYKLPPLPFPAVKRKGVEYPPSYASGVGKSAPTATSASATRSEADEPRDWRGLNSVPFLSPNDMLTYAHVCIVC